jgi:hypothetical protein
MAVYDPTSPTEMSPDQRLDEIASILAGGLLRLHRRVALSTEVSPVSLVEESEQIQLDVCGQSRTHGEPVNGLEQP